MLSEERYVQRVEEKFAFENEGYIVDLIFRGGRIKNIFLIELILYV